MALYWAAQAGTQAAQGMSTEAQYLWASALTAAGWVIVGVSAWWNSHSEPQLPSAWWLQTSWQVCTGDKEEDDPPPQ